MGPEVNYGLGSSASREGAPNDLPPLSALFVIYFDIKAGYTIAWKQTAEDISLDGVEFKSLPSGLHNAKEDLVYFVHGSYAGVSAFTNHPASEADRNALMISVGILVPLSYGRLGRSWKHAENLKELARSIGACKSYSKDTTQHQLLTDYYNIHRMATPSGSPPQSPRDSPSSLRYRPSASRAYKSAPVMDGIRAHVRARSISDATLVTSSTQVTKLSAYHPALSLVDFLDTFGPLVFPLYRAALARKRILLITQAPVESSCNFVYNISILSTIPLSVSSLISPRSPPDAVRLRPLFSIGVHDIPFLEEQAKRTHASLVQTDSGTATPDTFSAWVGCTTDGVLYLKSSLYDVVVTLPPPHSKNATKKVWPKIESPAGVPVKATQRDLRRYRNLRKGLEQYPGMSRDSRTSQIPTPSEEESVCERPSWGELAYSGFLWWASAGEKRHDNRAEVEGDTVAPVQGRIIRPRQEDIPLLDGPAEDEQLDEESNGVRRTSPFSSLGNGSSCVPQTPGLFGPRPNASNSSGGDNGAVEMDIIAYFHRLTARIIDGMAGTMETHTSYPEDDDEGSSEGETVDDDVDVTERTELLDGSGYGSRLAQAQAQAQAQGQKNVDVWFTREEMAGLGLDSWSVADERFLEEMGRRWWGKQVAVEKRALCGCC